MSSAKRPPSCLGLNESMSQWVNEAKNELMRPRLYLLWIHLCTFFPMFAIHMCEKICFVPEILVRHYVLCVCTCTNQLVLRTEVTRLNFLNSIVMGQINQCGFQSHVAIDRYCIFLEINTFELSWVEVWAWISNYILLFYVDVTTYPSPHSDASFPNLYQNSGHWRLQWTDITNILCLKDFDTFKRTWVRVCKMDAVSRAQLTFHLHFFT